MNHIQLFLSCHNLGTAISLEDVKCALELYYKDKEKILFTTVEMDESAVGNQKVIQILPKFSQYDKLLKDVAEKDKLIKEIEYNNTKALASIQSFHVICEPFFVMISLPSTYS